MEYDVESRYGDIHKIIEREDHYEFVIAEKCKDWVRYGYRTDPKHIEFVDPSGGPFVSVGSNLSSYHKDLPNKSIVRIDSDSNIKLFV